MALTLEQLREEYLALPPEDRQRFVSSLADEDEIAPLGLHPDWAEELHRRSEAYKAGKTQGIPWEDVQKELESLDDLA